MEALWLKSQKMSHKEICRLTGISPSTLRRYIKAYQQGGIDALKELIFYQPQSELMHHKATIEAYVREHPPASVKEAMAKIEELTGIKRSENRVREFLKSIGLSPRKVGMIPAKADPEEQESFVMEELEALKKPSPVKELSFLWMLHISCWRPFWEYCGLLHDYSSKPLLAGSDSTFWAR
jgi:transposase